VRRHDDGGCGRRCGGRGVGVQFVDARKLQAGVQQKRRGRGRFVGIVLLLVRVQWGICVRWEVPGLVRKGCGGRVQYETRGARLDLAVVWINGSG
jgi:hypothetical protein